MLKGIIYFSLGAGAMYLYMKGKQKAQDIAKATKPTTDAISDKVTEAKKEILRLATDSDMTSLNTMESDEDGFHYDVAFAEGNTKFKVIGKDKNGNVVSESPILKVQEVPFEGYQVVED